MLQLKKRKDSTRGMRFMATMCFYQDARHDTPLSWIRDIFAVGYLSHRNDGMTELRINGYKQIESILKSLLPYIRFKKIQAEALCVACGILCLGTIKTLKREDLRKLVDLILVIQHENYVTKKKKTKSELYKILDLTP